MPAAGGVTLAVSVTGFPNTEGLAELASDVAVEGSDGTMVNLRPFDNAPPLSERATRAVPAEASNAAGIIASAADF